MPHARSGIAAAVLVEQTKAFARRAAELIPAGPDREASVQGFIAKITSFKVSRAWQDHPLPLASSPLMHLSSPLMWW